MNKEFEKLNKKVGIGIWNRSFNVRKINCTINGADIALQCQIFLSIQKTHQSFFDYKNKFGLNFVSLFTKE